MKAKIVEEICFFGSQNISQHKLIVLEGRLGYHLAVYISEDSVVKVKNNFNLKECDAYRILGEVDVPAELLEKVLEYVLAEARLNAIKDKIHTLIEKTKDQK